MAFAHSPLTTIPISLAPSFICRSAAVPSIENLNPTLSDQLHPLSLTILKQSDSLLPPPSKPNPTWLNPSKPKPSVLLPHRHRRPPLSHNPDLRRLSLLARSLSSSPDLSAALDEVFPDPPSREDALLLLNSLRPWRKSHRLFLWLQSKISPLDTIFYNVVLKALRAGRQYDLADSLAGEMINDNVPLDNITYSTLITCAKRCGRFDRALHWFDRIYRTGLMPDEVTYSAILDVYVQLGRREEAVALYERARAGGWTPDSVAFSVLAKMFGEAGDFDGIQYVLKEIETLGVKPNVVVYNTLLEALGKAGKPGLARNLFDEMLAAGLSPDERTLTSLIKIYGKARWGRNALELWERMRANKWPVDFILYNTLLNMCADLGMVEEAEKLFDEMQQSARSQKPDNFSYSAMINLYSSGGKSEKALKMFDDMLQRGVEPNVMGCTCLIQCLGKAGRIDDAVRVFGVAMDRGIKPDGRLCGCLLSLVSLCSDDEEASKVLACLEKGNPSLVKFIEMIRGEEAGFEEVKGKLRGILSDASVDVRRPFCNCLIDICRNRGFPSQRAHELLRLGMMYGLYAGLESKGLEEWSLNLRSLSVGAANTAFEEWIERLSDSMENEEENLPQIFSVHTGSGAHKFSHGLANSFSSYLKKIAAPFRQNGESGRFVTVKEELVSWFQSRTSYRVV
ncbi:Pentatricopeptide repeat-containing protein [Apostasia shenzhenica]|uniref:Pentatricopeptide repeat-containing protein n=1 Tax=Apostasia shenzhenica TaxID=1088818 RepID=A0A2I0AWZ6_9ASPA|nr:Pentatricopeptide repeat-containing protein [Apostasia shenzhenica]